MGLTLSKGWRMASVVTVTGLVLLALNARALATSGAERMLVLSAASAVFIVGLGVRLLLDVDRSGE